MGVFLTKVGINVFFNVVATVNSGLILRYSFKND